MDNNNLRVWTWPADDRPHTFLYTRALEAREYCERHVLSGVFPRDDYEESAELTIKFLGGQVKLNLLYLTNLYCLVLCLSVCLSVCLS